MLILFMVMTSVASTGLVKFAWWGWAGVGLAGAVETTMLVVRGYKARRAERAHNARMAKWNEELDLRRGQQNGMFS